ncbi:hypothetical protein BsWGS_13933 [Bradybaena similaris]
MNLVCILVFAVNHGLRYPTNIFFLALNVCDFIICSVVCSACAISAWFKLWIWGRNFCVAEGFLYYSLVVTSLYIITYISFHRYVIICNPSWVPEFLRKRDYSVCVVCFTAGCLLAAMPVVGWNHYQLEVSGITCGPAFDFRVREHTAYMYLIIALGLAIPFAVLTFSYCSILSKVENLNRRTSDESVISHVSTARINLRIEKNVMWTCFLIILSFLVCWTPTFVVYAIHEISEQGFLPTVVLALPSVIGKMQGLLNPIVYVLTHTQMREATMKWCSTVV